MLCATKRAPKVAKPLTKENWAYIIPIPDVEFA